MKKRNLAIIATALVAVLGFAFLLSGPNKTANIELSPGSETYAGQRGADTEASGALAQEVVDTPIQEVGAAAYDKFINQSPQTKANADGNYPAYYGGAYINDEGELVVYTTDISQAEQETKIMEMDPESFMLEPCEYTFNELTGIMDTLNEYVMNNSNNITANIKGFGIRDNENRIRVNLLDVSDEKVAEFKQAVCDSDALYFIEATSSGNSYVDVHPGDEITRLDYSASVGYRAKRDGAEGFVTASHFAQKGFAITYDGTVIATTDVSERGGPVDAAFCRITKSGYTPSNILSGTSNTLSTLISEPGVGTTINKIGAQTKHTTGTVTSTNHTEILDGYILTNLTVADFEATNGDSGGIVYSYIGSTNTRLTIGLIMGGDGADVWCVKANEVNKALGISRY